MYRVVNINSREVLSHDELKTYSEAVHLAREAERHDSEPDVEVQVINDGKWTRAENNQSIYVETIDRNGDLYSFSAEGFTVHLQEEEGGNFRVVRGIVASSPQDAIDKAKLWLGCCGFTSVKVYPGNDGWYSNEECIYKESQTDRRVWTCSCNGQSVEVMATSEMEAKEKAVDQLSVGVRGFLDLDAIEAE